MPEMPEVESLAQFLTQKCVGRVIARIDLVAFSALKTYSPPLSALIGLEVEAVHRHGKFLEISAQGLTWCSIWQGPAGCDGGIRFRMRHPNRDADHWRCVCGWTTDLVSTSPRPGPSASSLSTSSTIRCPSRWLQPWGRTHWPTTSTRPRWQLCSRRRAGLSSKGY